VKKIEASLIKRLLRISGRDLVNSVLELSHFSLSLSYSWILRVFLEHSWRGGILGFWSKKEKEEQESARGHRDQQLHQICVQVPSCMHDFFTSLDMHGICMWILGHDLSLA